MKILIDGYHTFVERPDSYAVLDNPEAATKWLTLNQDTRVSEVYIQADASSGEFVQALEKFWEAHGCALPTKVVMYGTNRRTLPPDPVSADIIEAMGGSILKRGEIPPELQVR